MTGPTFKDEMVNRLLDGLVDQGYGVRRAGQKVFASVPDAFSENIWLYMGPHPSEPYRPQRITISRDEAKVIRRALKKALAKSGELEGRYPNPFGGDAA